MSWWTIFFGGYLLGIASFAVFHLMVVNEWRAKVNALKATVFGLDETVVDLENQLHPMRWVDNPETNMKVKQRLYDQYPDLVRPGTETIDLTEVEDE